MGWRTTRYGPDITNSWSELRPASIRHWRPRARTPVQERRPASKKKMMESAIRQPGTDLSQNLFCPKIEYAIATSKMPQRARRSNSLGWELRLASKNGDIQMSHPAPRMPYAKAGMSMDYRSRGTSAESVKPLSRSSLRDSFRI